jgi:hypothetical protein
MKCVRSHSDISIKGEDRNLQFNGLAIVAALYCLKQFSGNEYKQLYN